MSRRSIVVWRMDPLDPLDPLSPVLPQGDKAPAATIQPCRLLPLQRPEPALDQCRSWGLDRNNCIAKRLVKDGSPADNSAYLDR